MSIYEETKRKFPDPDHLARTRPLIRDMADFLNEVIDRSSHKDAVTIAAESVDVFSDFVYLKVEAEKLLSKYAEEVTNSRS